ncbi:hypothetical protein DFH27DRAFT_591211 [Peziza echinospora]|nr:hypothetical protein DFH27DRAFT_591211 [Peziza echinospora]
MPPLLAALHPPLLNSSSPAATTSRQLKTLHASPHLGAITTRTTTLHGYPHDPSLHKHYFVDPSTCAAISPQNEPPQQPHPLLARSATHPLGILNTYGYSPFPLRYYLATIKDLLLLTPPSQKPIILSLGILAPTDLDACFALIAASNIIAPPTTTTTIPRVWIELNLSCPNLALVPHAPSSPSPPPLLLPLSHDPPSLTHFLQTALLARKTHFPFPGPHHPPPPLGLKLPPYPTPEILASAFSAIITACEEFAHDHHNTHAQIAYLASTNTLGNSLLLPFPDLPPPANALTGGLSGPPLHLLSLGNVAALAALVRASPCDWVRENVGVVGVGGVSDAAGYGRMRGVGAGAVGVAMPYHYFQPSDQQKEKHE